MPGGVAIGERIRVLREERGWSREQLSRRLGGRFSPRVIQTWEEGPQKGAKKVPADDLAHIATALGVTVGELYGETPHDAQRRERADQTLDRLREILEQDPARIEINVYVDAAAGLGHYQPTAADRDTRDVMKVFDSLTEDQRREWLEFAEAIRDAGGA